MNRSSILTISDRATAEIEEKKSRFIAIALPVSNEKEALAVIAMVKAEYKNARHYVYAWSIEGNNNNTRCSDDGEPSRTAGAPVLDLIKNSGLKDIIIIVVRYFGGTLLGSGGLIRAYTGSAQLVLEQCQKAEKIPAIKVMLSFDYSVIKRVDRLLRGFSIDICERVFQDKVSYICLLNTEEYPVLAEKLDKVDKNIRLDNLGESGYIYREV